MIQVLGFFCFFETGYANVIELPSNIKDRQVDTKIQIFKFPFRFLGNKFANVSVVGGTPAAAGEFPNLVS
jgi:hypothetical protein